uniref:PD-(D/E)XK nuclease domain-containing protein n=1 Tax=Acetatifactor sp. TaxID=1872090 RepID=UPI004056B3EF
MDNFLEIYIKELQRIDTVKQYDDCLNNLKQALTREGYDAIVQTVRVKGKYMANKFSDDSTLESMLKSKENLIAYLKDIMREEIKDKTMTVQKCLSEYLHNFYFFLEAFREMEPHKKATLSPESLRSIQIKNEYDLQHLLYAAIKPLCADTRTEVTEDTGCGTVRSDIKIPNLKTVVEAKCTRTNMSLKKLTEEIEADIVHYEADYIYFYIYDKEKIVKDRQAFEATFNRDFDGKHIEVIILQPVYM